MRQSHSCIDRSVPDVCPVRRCGTGRYRAAPSVAGPTVRGPSVERTDLDAHGRHRPLQADVRSCRSVPSVSSWRGLDRQIVERTRCGAQPGFGNMQVARCRLEIAMAEQQLDAAQISPGIQQVCRERVAQNMRAQRLLDTKLLTQLLAHHPDCVRLQRLSRPFPLKQPVLGLAPPPVPPLRGYLLQEPVFSRGNRGCRFSVRIRVGLLVEVLWQRSLRQESNLQPRDSLRRGGIRHCSPHYSWGSR